MGNIESLFININKSLEMCNCDVDYFSSYKSIIFMLLKDVFKDKPYIKILANCALKGNEKATIDQALYDENDLRGFPVYIFEFQNLNKI